MNPSDKVARAHAEIAKVQQKMSQNIDRMVENSEMANDLEEKSLGIKETAFEI